MKKVFGTTPTGGRHKNDYYATEPVAVKLLLNQEKFDFNIWECASGGKHSVSINGLQTDVISVVRWHVGMYEMPQCTARGIPLPLVSLGLSI